jgi:small subunit ribosomal protein S1
MDDDQPIDDKPEFPEEQEESFADLFESYSKGMNEDLRVGDKLHGRIISISDSSVFIDTNTKADGVVDIEELRDEEGKLPYAVGDELDLYVVSADESEIRLSRAISGAGGLGMLKDAYSGAIPVEGRVQQVIKGGFQVEVIKRRAFCPISQIDIHFVNNPEEYVGKTYQFLIKKLTENGRNIVLSRRDLLAAEQKEAHQAFMEQLAVNQVLTGRVTRLMPYGAFVELIPGLEGMVHISELSWSRLDKPEDAVHPDEMIQVKVLRIEAGDKGPKIALSVKQAGGDPWLQLPEEIQVGRKISGKVTRCTNFGAFVELKPGIEGLVHISELSYTQRVHKTEDVVQPGENVTVVIKEIDVSKRRVSLSLRDAQGDPWAEVGQKYAKGQPVDGTVEKVEKFGVFVRLEPGVVGLLPKSTIAQAGSGMQIEQLKPGQTIGLVVESVNPAERKISLKPRDGDSDADWKKFKGEPARESAMGTMGDLLSQALKDRKE